MKMRHVKMARCAARCIDYRSIEHLIVVFAWADKFKAVRYVR